MRAPSCYNLAVMYKHGDIGVEKDDVKFDKIKGITEELVQQGGELGGGKKTG